MITNDLKIYEDEADNIRKFGEKKEAEKKYESIMKESRQIIEKSMKTLLSKGTIG